MSQQTSKPRFRLYYWPIPFRGCFVSYLFAYRGIPLLEETDYGLIGDMMTLQPGEQDLPFMGPPVIHDIESDRRLSQMPAIVLYVARELDFMPEDPFDTAMCMKVLMDCNDVLMEICRYNGSFMWAREDWIPFRSQRLPRWMQIFETSLDRGFIDREPVSYADIAVYALFGNMIRCLPEFEADLMHHAPRVHGLSRRIGSRPSLAKYVAEQEDRYGKLYCGGQIEESIRAMLAMDAEQ